MYMLSLHVYAISIQHKYTISWHLSWPPGCLPPGKASSAIVGGQMHNKFKTILHCKEIQANKYQHSLLKRKKDMTLNRTFRCFFFFFGATASSSPSPPQFVLSLLDSISEPLEIPSDILSVCWLCFRFVGAGNALSSAASLACSESEGLLASPTCIFKVLLQLTAGH